MVKVTVSQGILAGSKCKTAESFEYNAFIQIPYATPPLGELRFKSPQLPEKWEGERNASEANDKLISLQYVSHSQEIVGSEDCLYLNVYTTLLPSDGSSLLPVMVYIHGGAFLFGNGTLNKDCNPDFFIDKGFVVVTINYRLGIFGFLSLDIPEAAGNMGLKDQVMALKWIQNNISKFGGDKDNVTVFGISAGAASIEYLLLSPLSRGLYHRAIIQSGSALNHWASNYEIKNISIKIAFELGYKGPSDDYRGIYEFLMAQPTETISIAVKLTNNLNSKGLDFFFVPSIEKDFGNDEAFLTEYPYDLIKEGRFNKVPIIRGYCEFEGLLLAALKPQDIEEIVTKKNFFDFWKYSLNSNNINKYDAKFKNAYNEDKDNKEQFAIDFFGDFDFTSGICISNKLMVAHGVPTYGYMFSYDGNTNFIKNMFNLQKKGASHGDDTCYTMNVELPDGVKPSDTDVLIRKRISKMWTDFAKIGNPSPTASDIVPIIWPALNSTELKYLVIHEILQVRTPYDIAKIAIFEEIYEQYRK